MWKMLSRPARKSHLAWRRFRDDGNVGGDGSRPIVVPPRVSYNSELVNSTLYSRALGECTTLRVPRSLARRRAQEAGLALRNQNTSSSLSLSYCGIRQSSDRRPIIFRDPPPFMELVGETGAYFFQRAERISTKGDVLLRDCSRRRCGVSLDECTPLTRLDIQGVRNFIECIKRPRLFARGSAD